MENLLVLITFLVPVIAGLTELFKKYVPAKYVPATPIVLGVFLALIASPLPFVTLSLIEVIWAGLLAGMSAGGLYSVQNMRNK